MPNSHTEAVNQQVPNPPAAKRGCTAISSGSEAAVRPIKRAKGHGLTDIVAKELEHADAARKNEGIFAAYDFAVVCPGDETVPLIYDQITGVCGAMAAWPKRAKRAKRGQRAKFPYKKVDESKEEWLLLRPFIIMGPRKPALTLDNVPVLLRMAHKYDIPYLKRELQDFLMATNISSLRGPGYVLHWLLLAIQCELPNVVDRCVNFMRGEMEVQLVQAYPPLADKDMLERIMKCSKGPGIVVTIMSFVSLQPSLEHRQGWQAWYCRMCNVRCIVAHARDSYPLSRLSKKMGGGHACPQCGSHELHRHVAKEDRGLLEQLQQEELTAASDEEQQEGGSEGHQGQMADGNMEAGEQVEQGESGHVLAGSVPASAAEATAGPASAGNSAGLLGPVLSPGLASQGSSGEGSS